MNLEYFLEKFESTPDVIRQTNDNEEASDTEHQSDDQASSSSSSDSNDEEDDRGIVQMKHTQTLEHRSNRLWIVDDIDDSKKPPMWLGIYKCLLFHEKEKHLHLPTHEHYTTNILERVQALKRSSQKWMIILFRSGRFASGIFQQDQVLHHRAFQRYTTRRKQGGSQSANDANSGNRAKSAGATLRRYNEQALREDVEQLFRTWDKDIQEADLILLAIPKTSRNLFFPTLLNKDDPRIRRIPFNTQRPTYQEVCRVHTTLRGLSREKYTKKIEEEKKDEVSSTLAPVAPVMVQKEDLVENKIVLESLTPLMKACELEDQSTFTRLLEEEDTCCKKNSSDDTSENEILQNGIHAVEPASLSTALHYAAKANNSAFIHQLLLHGANPCITDLHGRPPYYLCQTKDARNVFRRYMSDFPTKWDYAMAKIPSALTSEMEDQQREKEREKKKKARARQKEKKKQQKAEIAAAEAQAAAAELEAQKAKRIHAKLSDSRCNQCQEKLKNLRDAIHRLDYVYCSTKCAMDGKRQLLASAALDRFNK